MRISGNTRPGDTGELGKVELEGVGGLGELLSRGTMACAFCCLSGKIEGNGLTLVWE